MSTADWGGASGTVRVDPVPIAAASPAPEMIAAVAVLALIAVLAVGWTMSEHAARPRIGGRGDLPAARSSSRRARRAMMSDVQPTDPDGVTATAVATLAGPGRAVRRCGLATACSPAPGPGRARGAGFVRSLSSRRCCCAVTTPGRDRFAATGSTPGQRRRPEYAGHIRRDPDTTRPGPVGVAH